MGVAAWYLRLEALCEENEEGAECARCGEAFTSDFGDTACFCFSLDVGLLKPHGKPFDNGGS